MSAAMGIGEPRQRRMGELSDREVLAETLVWIEERATVLQEIIHAHRSPPAVADLLRSEVARLRGRASLIKLTHFD